jgi:hypothetical protein
MLWPLYGFQRPLTDIVRLLKQNFKCNLTELDSTICRRSEQGLAIGTPRDCHLEGFIEHEGKIK